MPSQIDTQSEEGTQKMANTRIHFLERAQSLLTLMRSENINSAESDKISQIKLSAARSYTRQMADSLTCPAPGMTAAVATTFLKVGLCQELTNRFVLEYCLKYTEQNISVVMLSNLDDPRKNHAIVFIGPIHARDNLFIGKGSALYSEVNPKEENQTLHEFISENQNGIFADPLLDFAGNSNETLNPLFEYCKKQDITHVVGIRSYFSTPGLLDIAPTIKENARKIANHISFKPEAKEKNSEKSDIDRLAQLSLQVALKNKNNFFKERQSLPEKMLEKYPELDIDYKRQFCTRVKQLIQSISFKPNEKEKSYLDKIENALKSEMPYNAIHPILIEIDQDNKKGFLSTFKKNMEPLRLDIIKFMKEYNENKKEYVKHFGKPGGF